MLVAAVVAALVVVSCWPRPSPPAVDAEPVSVHRSDLPRLVYRQGEYIGRSVRVAFPVRLAPTADPLVWNYRPGGANILPTHRLHFADPPEFGPLPVVVVGTVEGIAADLQVRPNGVPGVVVLRGCAVRPLLP